MSIAGTSSSFYVPVSNYTKEKSEKNFLLWSQIKEADKEKCDSKKMIMLVLEYLKENPEFSLSEIERKLRIHNCNFYIVALNSDYSKFKNLKAIDHLGRECLYIAQFVNSLDMAISMMKTISGGYYQNLEKLPQTGFAVSKNADLTKFDETDGKNSMIVQVELFS